MTMYFDVETGPLPDAELERVKPEFRPPANFKDPEKIALNMAEQEKEWRDKAALSAVTGKVLVVGVLEPVTLPDVVSRVLPPEKISYFNYFDNEQATLSQFWSWLERALTRGDRVVGFNIFGFDLPFLIRRSWILGVPVPCCLRERYWNENFVDLMDKWCAGNRDQRISLDMLARALGVGAKNGNGADFAGLWSKDNMKARVYLNNDLLLLRKCHERMM